MSATTKRFQMMEMLICSEKETGQEAQLMLTTGSTRLAVNQGQQT